MTVTNKEAQAALELAREKGDMRASDLAPLQLLIDAMPDDPESRAERLGRMCQEGYIKAANKGLTMDAAYIAAAAAVEQQCKPREVTEGWLRDMILGMLRSDDFYDRAATRINTYIRGEDA